MLLWYLRYSAKRRIDRKRSAWPPDHLGRIPDRQLPGTFIGSAVHPQQELGQEGGAQGLMPGGSGGIRCVCLRRAATTDCRGCRFRDRPGLYPTKDETADYLEAYARAFELPVRTGVKVDRLAKSRGSIRGELWQRTLFAENVVVATGAFNNPRVPSFARELDESIVQLHSKEYRNPSQIQEGRSARRGRRELRGGDCHRTRSPSPDMVIRPGHGAGAHPGRKSSRSPAHAHDVVRGDAVDGQDGAWKEAPRPLSRPPRGIPLGRVRRKDFAPAGIERVPRTTGCQGTDIPSSRMERSSRVERHLVHRIHAQLRLDRSLAADPQWPSHSRSGHRRVLSRSLLHGASLPLLAELGAGGRCGADAEHIVDHIVANRSSRTQEVSGSTAPS